MCCSKKTQKQKVEVTTPPPTADELDAREQAKALQAYQLNQGGVVLRKNEDGTYTAEPREPTQEELDQQNIDKEIQAYALRKIRGEVTPEEQARLDEQYGSALDIGKSDLQAEFSRANEQLGIGESRALEEIQRTIRGAAAARGLTMGDSPVLDTANRQYSILGEDVARNKRILGEDQARNLRNLETGLLGAKAGAAMNVASAGQLFGQALREFQQGMQQQTFINNQTQSDAFSNTANMLGQLRSRNYTQTGTNLSMGGANVGGILGGVGALFQGGASLMGAMGGSGGGAAASGASSWFSSKDFKEDISLVDVDVVLNELDTMPIYTWRYKGDDRWHTGPVTEESSERIVEGKTLVPIDCFGFLCAAVKALSAKVKALESK